MAFVVDFTCHVSSGMLKASATALASSVLPVPGSPFTSSGRLSATAALTLAMRESSAM